MEERLYQDDGFGNGFDVVVPWDVAIAAQLFRDEDLH